MESAEISDWRISKFTGLMLPVTIPD